MVIDEDFRYTSFHTKYFSYLEVIENDLIFLNFLTLGIYNYRSEHLQTAVQLAATSPLVFQALSIIKGCVSDPIGLNELQVLERQK